MKTKKPSAIVYHWDRLGEVILTSDIYFQERLYDQVVVYSLEWTGEVEKDFAKFKPDLVLTFKPIVVSNPQIANRTRQYPHIIPDNVLANDIVCQSTFINCQNPRPTFSIFTPTYKTGDRIFRAYQSLKDQTFQDWEWVVVDDSPENDNDTWNKLQEIASQDHRVKTQRIYPLTGGNVGLAKHRAGMLCEGKWLVELDHDDALLPHCLQECYDASLAYPDAGFIYSDFTSPYEDDGYVMYDRYTTPDWYARPDNYFCFGYAGHEWEEFEGKRYLRTFYPEINPRTIRFNISMPNHVRIWRKDVYHQIGGHNKQLPVADDLELIIRTFLATKMLHVKKMLYIQYHSRNSTVDNNSVNINRLSRLIRDHYDKAIHERIIELGGQDWDWDEVTQTSPKFLNNISRPLYHENEKYLNYIYV
jgi:O-antigen biosynthesis protein